MRVLVVGALLLGAVGSWGLDIHVAPNGSDTNAGAEAAPLATLAAARDAARGAGEAVTVWLHDGVYVLDAPVTFGAEDSGTEAAPVQYRAQHPGAVRIWGGRALEGASFAPVPEESRLPEPARSQVMRSDLGAAGITALGAYPDQFRSAVTVPELFFNGERMNVARWPNEGWAEIEKVVESGPAPWRKHESDALGIFTYSGDHPSRWAGIADLWIEGYWCFDWASETIRVKSVDPSSRQIALAKQHVYGLGSGNPAPRRFRAVNLLEELDEAGEYYIDRNEKALYFWPPATLDGAEIVLSLQTEPLLTLSGASHVMFSGLTVEYCAGTAIDVKDGAGVTVAGCTIRNAGQRGVNIDGGTGHTVLSCDIHHNGTGGIEIKGGDRKTLAPSGHRVVNNHIYRVSERMRTAAYNIRMNGVGIYVAHNEINDAPHQAIGVGGNDHVFEFNDIHHVSMESDDCGAFYMGRNPSHRGISIRYNYWHEIGSKMAHGSCAIYFDDGDGGQTVHGNVFYKASGGNFGAVFNHGGHDNIVTNNIFIECDQAIGSAPWGDARWKEWLEGDLWTKWLREDVDITKPPYTERYPDLRGFYEPQGLRLNHADNNVAVKCKNFVEGNWMVGQSLVTMEDPGFADREGGNFALKADAQVYQWLPDFEPIPFGKIGLYKDEYRNDSK